MHLPSELEASAVVPALRAMLARELLSSGKMNQSDVGSLLGITQSAVSNYITGTRARRSAYLETPYIRERIAALALSLNRNDGYKAAKGLTELTQFIRKNRLMCEMHRDMDPDIDVDLCHICEEE